MTRRLLVACTALGALAVTVVNLSRAEAPPRHAALRPADRVRAASIDSIASPAAPGSAEPNLTVGPDGRVYLSWLEPANPGYSLRFAVHDGTRWSPAQTIVTRSDFFVNWADFPSL